MWRGCVATSIKQHPLCIHKKEGAVLQIQLEFKRTAILFRVYFCHVLDEVDDLVGITPFVVIPGDQLDKVIVQ